MALGRRERNKEEKRERILAAATALFAVRSADDVTTQEIAEAADIGAGTLFLYAKNKGELLLMVQNAHYADALAEGASAAESEAEPADAVMALVSPIAVCNRAHVGNGRTYLREMMFGDSTERHHLRALEIVEETEVQLAATLMRTARFGAPAAAAASVARAVSALLFRSLAAPEALSGQLDEILRAVRADVARLVAPLV